MQHALKHVERPGGSHTALDGKKNQNSGYLVWVISAGLWWLDGNTSCCLWAGGQEPKSHCGKHKATVETDIRRLHSHTGSRSIEHGKKLLAVRRWSRLWEANAAMTSCVSRSFDFCAITSRYLLRDRTPSFAEGFGLPEDTSWLELFWGCVHDTSLSWMGSGSRPFVRVCNSIVRDNVLYMEANFWRYPEVRRVGPLVDACFQGQVATLVRSALWFFWFQWARLFASPCVARFGNPICIFPASLCCAGARI